MKCFDPVRGKPVHETPEERVRQQIVAWLLGTLRVPRHLIQVEFGLRAIQKGNPDRVDILVPQFRSGSPLSEPWLLVECKRPDKFTLADLQVQVNRYLRVVHPLYIMLGLGDDRRFLKRTDDGKGYSPVETLPPYPVIPE